MSYMVFIFTACTLTYLLKQLLNAGPNKVKFYFKFLIFFIWTSLSASLVIPFGLIKPKYTGHFKCFFNLLALVNPLLGLEHQLRDAHFLTGDGGAVVVVNHQSVLDHLVGAIIWRQVKYNFSFILKREVLYYGPYGIFTYLAGGIFIDRKNPKSAHNDLQVSKDRMIVNKNKIWIFPEGTRNGDHSKLLPFKKGAFNLAVEAQVPIIPIVISPYVFLNWKTSTFSRGRVIIQCLEPISTTSLTKDDVPALVTQVYDKMNAAYENLSKEYKP